MQAIETAKADTLTAHENIDGWHVVDSQGGTWWPSDEAADEIQAASDPEQAALAMCRTQNMRGTWKA